MKNISVDPHSDSVETGPEDVVSSSSQSSPRSSITSSGSLLALGELTLDGNRSDETASLSSPTVLEVSVDQSPSGISNSKSVTAKRYPSFRDMFMKQINRGRRSSSVSNTPDVDRSLQDDMKNPRKKKRKKKKDKTGGTGCAGWLEKKKKRKHSSGETTGASFSSSAESSNESNDQPPPLVTPQEVKEKEEHEDNEEDNEQIERQYATGSVRGGGTYTKRPADWTYKDELDVDSLHLSAPLMIRIAPLARLALDALIRNVRPAPCFCCFKLFFFPPYLPPLF